MAIIFILRRVDSVYGNTLRACCNCVPVVCMAIVVALQGFGSGLGSCDASWRFYKPYNVCIKSFATKKSYANAKKNCQNESGDLLQIWDDEMMAFLKSDIFQGMKYYWIGLSDLDRDGTFEYANGSKHVDKLFGQANTLCVAVNLNGYLTNDCRGQHPPICERQLSVKTQEQDKTACTPDSCVCKIRDWFYFEERDIYIKINKVNMNFTASQGLCEKMEGQLLTLYDDGITHYILNLDYVWRPTAIFYWVGLHDDGDGWYWVDGTREAKPGNLFIVPATQDLKCAAVIWDIAANLRPTVCHGAYYHICESQEPCLKKPTLSIDDTTLYSVKQVKLLYGHLMVVRCFTGPDNHIAEMLMYCGDNKFGGVGETNVNMSVHIDEHIHLKQCHCEATDPAANKAVSVKVTIVVMVSPRLKDRNIKKLGYSFTIGEASMAKLPIIAHPRPTTLTLTKANVVFDQTRDRFRVLDEPVVAQTGASFEYTIFVSSVTAFTEEDVATYNLEIGNGVGEMLLLELVFSEKKRVHAWKRLIVTMLSILAFFALLLVGTAYCLYVMGQNDSEKGTATIDSESGSSSNSNSRSNDSNSKSNSNTNSDDSEDDEDDDDDDDGESEDEEEDGVSDTASSACDTVSSKQRSSVHYEGSKPSVYEDKKKSVYIDDKKKSVYIDDKKKSVYIDDKKKSVYIDDKKKSVYTDDKKKSVYENKKKSVYGAHAETNVDTGMGSSVDAESPIDEALVRSLWSNPNAGTLSFAAKSGKKSIAPNQGQGARGSVAAGRYSVSFARLSKKMSSGSKTHGTDSQGKL